MVSTSVVQPGYKEDRLIPTSPTRPPGSHRWSTGVSLLSGDPKQYSLRVGRGLRSFLEAGVSKPQCGVKSGWWPVCVNTLVLEPSQPSGLSIAYSHFLDET